MKNLLFILLTALCAISLKADNFTSTDIGKILFIKNYRSFQQEERFLVLDEIRNNGSLICHLYGKNRKVSIKSDAVSDMHIYEGFNSFQITQYAFFAYVKKMTPNAYLELAEICGDTTGRMNKFAEFQRVHLRFIAEMNQIKKTFYADPADKLDDFYTLLENSTIPDLIEIAATSNDWVLTIAMSEGYRHTLESLQKINSDRDFINEVRRHFSNIETSLTEKFSARLEMNNRRKNLFLKYYPKSTGLWQRSAPKSYNEMVSVFFDKSLRSFFSLNQLSCIIQPQAWGTAVLDVLLLVENTPGAAELENQFDSQIHIWEKKSPAVSPITP